jgi:chemotaxis protein MotB
MTRDRRPAIRHERWLVSYADFITLLFAFFVVLYASAQFDRRVGELTQAIRSDFSELGTFQHSEKASGGSNNRASGERGVQTPASARAEEEEIIALQKNVNSILSEQIVRGEVSVQQASEIMTISLREVGFFAAGSTEIRPRSPKTLETLLKALHESTRPLLMEGHAGNVPISNSKLLSNWELSTTRATQLIRVLVENYGFLPETLSAAGYAEFRPVASNTTVQGRQSNRRVDLIVLHPNESQPPAVEAQS